MPVSVNLPFPFLTGQFDVVYSDEEGAKQVKLIKLVVAAVLAASAGAAAQQPRFVALIGSGTVYNSTAIQGPGAKAQRPGDALWNALASMCGKAFEGRMVEGTETGDKAMEGQRMVMHVRGCTADQFRIPFHVGENRSRTWVVTRTPTGLRLKHDHRHQDGSEDAMTQYGGDSRVADGLSIDFYADEFTAKLLPVSASNIWTMAVEPGRTFTYSLRREAMHRRFRVEFDLSKPVPPPPPPW